jgi:Ca2+-binding EF-hand superfamily protein
MMDVNQDGSLDPLEFKAGLMKMNIKLSEIEIERFIRMVEKNKSGRVDYMDFLDKMNSVANKNHNPFKTIITRIAYFVK